MHPTEPTRTYDDVVTPHMSRPTALSHVQAYLNVALLRRDRRLRFAAISDRIDAAAETAIDQRCLPTVAELDALAADIEAPEADDPTRR